MLTPHGFKRSLRRLITDPVHGMDLEDRLTRARQCLCELELQRASVHEPAELSPALEIVPPQTGVRPLDEALAPGHGASDSVALVNAERPDAEVCLLFRLRDLDAAIVAGRKIEVRLSAWHLPPAGGAPVPVPGLIDVPVAPRRVSESAYPRTALAPTRWEEFPRTTFVAGLAPDRQIRPTLGLDDRYGFAGFYQRRLLVELQLWIDGVARHFDTTELGIFDLSRSGSLYTRLTERLAAAGPAERAWAAGLRMIADRSAATVRAVVADLAYHRCTVPDPGWLLDVNLHLELLTCLAIAEVARAEYPDILGSEECRVVAQERHHAVLGRSLSLDVWRDAWALRRLAAPAGHAPQRWPLVTLLRAHVLDLHHALALAGPTDSSAPEVWHRLLRDYERAILRAGVEPARGLGRRGSGDDGKLVAAACHACRHALNDGLRLARTRGLLGFPGAAAIPAEASVWRALLRGDAGLIAELQRRDGEGRLPPPPARSLAGHVTGVRRPTPFGREVRTFTPHALAAQDDARAYPRPRADPQSAL